MRVVHGGNVRVREGIFCMEEIELGREMWKERCC